MQEKQSSGFPTRSDTNQAVQAQRMARGWKFRVYKVEELYYQCSENKGADQLCAFVFSWHGSYEPLYVRASQQFAYAKTKAQISFSVDNIEMPLYVNQTLKYIDIMDGLTKLLFLGRFRPSTHVDNIEMP